MTNTLNVVTAVSLDDASAAIITHAEPRIELVRASGLTRPWRWTADWEGDPDWHRTPAQQAEFEALLDGADALFGIPDVDPGALRRTVTSNGRLRWVHTTAAGGGAQVHAAALSADDLARVTFTTSAGIHAGPLSEFAVFGVLAGAKDLRGLEHDQQRKHWGDGRRALRQLEDMTVLIVGVGGIGRAAAARFAAFGATVWGTSRHDRPIPHVDRIIPHDRIAEAVPDVDAIVVTLPQTPLTIGLLSDDVFAAVRPGTILVNVGRGSVIDEDALVRALDRGAIGFAALDVTAVEPLPEASPLWTHERVLISPHTAALSTKEPKRIATLFAANATALLDGRPLTNVMSTAEFY